MTDKLSGKVCLVTGASRGIGAAIAAVLADHGARVVVHYGQNKDLAMQVAEDLSGDDHLVLGADLADPSAASGFIDQVIKESRRLDVLVNNAGIYVPHPPLEVDAEEWLSKWQETLSVNLERRGCYRRCRTQPADRGGRYPHHSGRCRARFQRDYRADYLHGRAD